MRKTKLSLLFLLVMFVFGFCSPLLSSCNFDDYPSISHIEPSIEIRIVYSRYYADTWEEVRPEDRYVFYTYNHYNDFQEYLNYKNGWGEIFGNITGGGTNSSKDPNQCNPTPYVETVRDRLS